MIKVVLREWHQTHTQNISGKIYTVRGRMAVLDEKGEASILGKDDVENYIVFQLSCIRYPNFILVFVGSSRS